MVLAPHPDDETLGCGGTLYKHHLAGDGITAVFMTDGSKGDQMGGGIRGEALIELRKREAKAAAAILGIGDCLFLHNPDTHLRASSDTIRQVRRLLDSTQPDVVYVPSPFESHRDHRRTCAIAAHALAGFPRPLEVYLYEVWTPVPANCVVSIDLKAKINAIRVYQSQMDEREQYVLLAKNLALYRGFTCLSSVDVPAECFLRLDRAAFVSLARSLA